MWRKLEEIAQFNTGVPDWVLLLIIILTAVLVLLLLYFARKAALRAEGLYSINIKLEDEISARKKIEKMLKASNRELDASLIYMIYALARAAEANDDDTGNHILRVGKFCTLIAQKLGLPKSFISDIRVQATLHDVGKIRIPAHILRKQGGFTSQEWEIMKKHTVYGSVIIGNHPRLAMAKNIALTHHEKWDGSGYPCGIKGDKIPIEGQITSISDHYDALRSSRPYKPAYTHEDACRIIIEGDDKVRPEHFSPDVMGAFKTLVSDFAKTYKESGERTGKDRFEKILCTSI